MPDCPHGNLCHITSCVASHVYLFFLYLCFLIHKMEMIIRSRAVSKFKPGSAHCSPLSSLCFFFLICHLYLLKNDSLTYKNIRHTMLHISKYDNVSCLAFTVENRSKHLQLSYCRLGTSHTISDLMISTFMSGISMPSS